jgi:hypothetical protein
MALETIRNGYRGGQIAEESRTSSQATMWINTDNLALASSPSLSALPILTHALDAPLLGARNANDCRMVTPTSPLARLG